MRVCIVFELVMYKDFYLLNEYFWVGFVENSILNDLLVVCVMYLEKYVLGIFFNKEIVIEIY